MRAEEVWTAPETFPYGVAKVANLAKIPKDHRIGGSMQSMTAKDAKYGFGRLIDLARAEPVTVEKHGRPVVVVLAVEEYERLKLLEISPAKNHAPVKVQK